MAARATSSACRATRSPPRTGARRGDGREGRSWLDDCAEAHDHAGRAPAIGPVAELVEQCLVVLAELFELERRQLQGRRRRLRGAPPAWGHLVLAAQCV